MKPPPFEYYDPDSTEAALSLLAELGEEAKILAGGQSLVPLLNFRLVRPAALIDINGIAELDGIEPAGAGLRIGALTRHRAVEVSPLVKERCPALAEAVPLIGHRQIRNRGTFGGSLAHADPSAELPLIVTLLDAEIRTRCGDQASTYRPTEFFQGYLSTALAPDELVTEIILPPWPSGAGWSFREVSARHGDFALVAAAALVELGETGTITSLRLAVGGVGPAPRRLRAGEVLAVGRAPGARLLSDLAEASRAEIEPDSDIHASAEYRSDVSAALIRRVVAEAAGRASASCLSRA